jgi:glycosyltransferase involved in cell wall biosynthesis
LAASSQIANSTINGIFMSSAVLAPHVLAPDVLANELELSVVMPCLNESETVGTCIQKALTTLQEHGIKGEVIVADNGSSDGSQEIAQRLGARVVHVAARGYGSALQGGIAAAKGRFILMGDADDSYDFRDIPKFVDALSKGADLVQGCRLPRGGGQILPGAMPLLHRWFGNPVLSQLVRAMFNAPINDVYCGMRGFTQEFYNRREFRCSGMEFATEMIIQASLFRDRIVQVPIILHPDGRHKRGSHLRTFRDGWRTLRFFLLYCPFWLFTVPGLLLIVLGLLGYGVALPGLTIFGATLDAHTLLVASLLLILGNQSVHFSIFSTTFAVSQRLRPLSPLLSRFYHVFRLERGIMIGVGTGVVGASLLLLAVEVWRRAHFGPLNYAQTMRLVIPGVTLCALGFQTILGSFFTSILGMKRG